MQDIIDQLLGYLKGVWNKRWHGMFITWLACIAGWAFVYQMPDVYESKAKIYIDTQSLLRPLLRGLTVQTNTSQEINLMVKTLLTRPNVEKIIRLADLDLSVNNEREFDSLVKKLQKNIKFNKPARSRINIYNLAYHDINPEIAQKVLQSVITVFIENTIGQNKDDSKSAKKFIDKQIHDYEKRLLESENRLKVFKQQNIGVLPSTTGGYYNKLEATKAAVAEIKLELQEAIRSKIALQKEVNSLISSIRASASSSANSLVRTSYDVRIEKLNLNLDELLLKYTDNHPDVKSIARILENLELKRITELKFLRESASAGGSALELNPVYQNLKINIGDLNSRISALRVRLTEYERRYTELTLLVDHIPEVEAKLSALNRDYAITKKKYGELLDRRETATLSASISNTSDGVQFNVIESPRLALNPTGPNRILLSSGILFLSILTGFAFAFFIAQIRPVFSSAKELESYIGLPLLGSVSAVVSPGQRRRRILLVLTYLSLLAVLLVVYAGLVAWYMEGFWKMIDSIIDSIRVLL